MRRLVLIALTAFLFASTAVAAHAAYVSGKSKASGDVNGDGRVDRVTFKGKQWGDGRLTVKLAKGKTVSTTAGLEDLTSPDAGIVAVRRGRITVMRDHISTCDTYVAYAYRKGALTEVDRYCAKGAKGG